MDVRQRITSLRKEAGITTNKLAKLASVGQSTLSDIESGKVKPSIDTLEKICQALGISLSEFFSDEQPSVGSRINLLTSRQRDALERFLETLEGR